MNGEFAHLDRLRKVPGMADINTGLTRLEVSPQIRYPFKRWPFFTVNSTLQWRDTYYTRSQLDSSNPLIPLTVVDDDLNRQYFTVQAQAVGPVFNRVWDTPDNGYAERFKHTIEPVFTLERISSIDDSLQARVIQNETSDRVVAGITSLVYSLNNRFYARRRVGQSTTPQEILSVAVWQKYYTDGRAAVNDPSVQTSAISRDADNKFSPLMLDVNAQPTPDFNSRVHAEFDSKFREPRLLTVNGTYAWTGRLRNTVGWTRKFLIKQLEGFNDPDRLDHYLNLETSTQTRDNRVGGSYTLYYDVLRSLLQQQSFSGFYNAQCCGLAVEYRIRHFGVTTDRSFFFSFSLAGLGNFSPLNGALSGIPR
jgi:hypothetical protein